MATGCFAQRYPEAIREEMPEVDVIMGVNDYQKLDEALRKPERADAPSTPTTTASSTSSDAC